jgi:RHS repeat-associated protein
VYAFSWEYDAAGNRTVQVRDGVPTYYDYNTLNQLTHEVTDGAHTYYTYDADGQLTSRQNAGGTQEFAWGFESRMREAVLPDETTWDYRYILGSQRWRKRKVDEEERTDFIYDGEKVAEEHDYDGANQATYTHAGSSIYSPLLAQRTDNTSAWFLQDALGSTMALIDSDEALLLQVLYDAWGNELLSNGNGQTPYRYVGAYGYCRDVETDLLYLWHRYYDPRVGRFTRRDPLASWQAGFGAVRPVLRGPLVGVPFGSLPGVRSLVLSRGDHRYAYAAWDAPTLVDPTGAVVVVIVPVIIGVIVGAGLLALIDACIESECKPQYNLDLIKCTNEAFDRIDEGCPGYWVHFEHQICNQDAWQRFQKCADDCFWKIFGFGVGTIIGIGGIIIGFGMVGGVRAGAGAGGGGGVLRGVLPLGGRIGSPCIA